jgi:serine/threonine protein kinase
MALAPGAQLGSYQISSLLGTGGMGEVYRAHDPKLKRDVAIKILPLSRWTIPRVQPEQRWVVALVSQLGNVQERVQ